jgi:hypothetical protein
VFLVAYIVGALIKEPVLALAMPVGFIVCLAIVMGVKGVRMMPVAHEEYALTNRRAFSIFNCNGTTLMGDMWLDSQTSIQTRRCGQKNASVIFTRRQAVGPADKHQPKSFVAFLNFADAEAPRKVAVWAVADTAQAQQVAGLRAA